MPQILKNLYWQKYHQSGLKETEALQNKIGFWHLYLHRQEIGWENNSIQIQAILGAKMGLSRAWNVDPRGQICETQE